VATIRNSRVAKLKALIIDDMSGVRANLRTQLLQLGIRDAEQAASAAEALRSIALRPFDLVLCDYNLGGDTNGQQLLEHVRAKKLLQPVTIWFMVTAESSYDYVAIASDFAPDDYLIKPFTAANLESRLMRHFERQDALEPALKKMAAGNMDGAVTEFSRLVQSGSKFTMDALRQKARCLAGLSRHDEAKTVYAQALAIRQGVPWAELGFARALCDAGDLDKAYAAAATIAVANPKLVGAYELLAEIHQARGDETQTLEALRQAEMVVPSTKRTRALGDVAQRMGNLEVAKAAYAKVVAATRNSVTKNPYDNATLAQIYMDNGESAKALEALKPVQQEFAEEAGFQSIAAAVEARAHLATGNDQAAGAALERALQYVKNADPAAALAVSKACFALGKEAEGERIVTRAVRANHEDAQLVAAARKVLKDAGRDETTGSLVDAQVQEMLGLTERALALAKKAQLAEAQAIIAEAVAGMPKNVGVLVAAAQINLLFLSQKGMDVEVATRVRGYLATLDTLAHGTERVVKMGAFFKELLLKGRPGVAA
jgi:DNA-binding response OmpR family regulator/cell division inhibitor SulA